MSVPLSSRLESIKYSYTEIKKLIKQFHMEYLLG